MNVENRPYQILYDFKKVSDFLNNNFDEVRMNNYFLQPLFEYGENHGLFHYHCSHRNRIWEVDGEIVGIVFYEMMFWGRCFLVTRPGYHYLKQEMLQYAEDKMSVTENGTTCLKVWVTDANIEDIHLLKNKGYVLTNQEDIMIYDYQKRFTHHELPEGFRIVKSDEIDPKKLFWCNWKGFDNGNSLREGIKEQDKVYQSEHLMHSPHYRKDLTTIIEAPDGEYACLAGMWLDGEHDYAYLEPLVTIPKYRKMKLASIALMTAMEKTAKLGKKYCIGGAVPFYKSVGFEKYGERHLYQKNW